jgi:hypothetical protein
MEIEIKETVKVSEIHLCLMPDGKPETVVRFVREYGDIIEQVRLPSLEDALEYIRKQGE